MTVKKVIFVGGTAYSGSTLLDMILANDPRGLSCGEINAVFYPYRPHHLALHELSAKIDWRALKRGGAERLYQNLFEWYPDVDFIVDSSKSPLWIAERSAELARAGIAVENILIWKHPEMFRSSRKKRNREQGWQREWINYHRYYFSVVDRWRAVRYQDLVTNRHTLTRLCSLLGLPHFAGKEQFWRKEHATAFGNARAKIHLFDRESARYVQHKREIDCTVAAPPADHSHRVLYCESEGASECDAYHKIRPFNRILSALEYADIANASCDPEYLKQVGATLHLGRGYRAYQTIKQKYAPLRVRDLLLGNGSLSLPRRP